MRSFGQDRARIRWIARQAATCTLAGFLGSTLGLGSAAALGTEIDIVREAALRVCQSSGAVPVAGARALPDPFSRGGISARNLSVSDWALENGQRLRMSTVGAGPRKLVFSDLYEGDRAAIRAVAGRNCQIIGGRAVDYGTVAGATVPLQVRHLDASLTRTRAEIPLNPPVPRGSARSCLRVGLLDNGVNYTRSDIAARLAYRPDGSLIGLDTWEGDGRPFDYGAPPEHPDPRRSIFNPRRHGTAVAGVLLEHAPQSACLVPVRYPPFGSDRAVEQAISFLAGAGVRIVSIQSGRARPWPALRRAMEAHPEILFIVAAGNEGRDLSRTKRYPASYDLPNMLVVVGTDRSGTALWPQTNRGGPATSIGYRAANLDVAVFDGSKQRLSGTSFSAPAVAGIAASLLARDTGMSTQALRAALLDLARTQGTTAGGVPVLPGPRN